VDQAFLKQKEFRRREIDGALNELSPQESALSEDVMVSVRAIHFAATMMVGGVIFFIVFITEPTFRASNVDLIVRTIVRSRIARLAWISLVLATISGAAWLVLTAAEMSDRPPVAVLPEGILWVVLSQTGFGRTWFIRFLLVCILVVALGSFLSPQRVQASWFKAAMVALAAVQGLRVTLGPQILLGLLEGVTEASVLALTAVGLSLVFGVMRIINVAHGDFFMLGAVRRAARRRRGDAAARARRNLCRLINATSRKVHEPVSHQR
jgi:hypothetical protein